MNTWCPPLVSKVFYDLLSKPIVYALEEVVSICMLVNHLADKTPQTPPFFDPLSVIVQW